MIQVYPLLVPESCSGAVVPGICKSLEMFTLIYKQNELIKNLNISQAVSLSLFKHESKNLSEMPIGPPSGPTVSTGNKPRPKSNIDTKLDDIYDLLSKKDKPKKDDEIKALKAKNDLKSSSIEISEPKAQSLSVEPTWVRISVRQHGIDVPMMIGVKVVPFIVKSDENILKYLQHDFNSVKFVLNGYARKFEKIAFRYIDKLKKVVTLVDKPLTGMDVRNEVLLGRTSFSNNIFLGVDFLDSYDEVFMNNNNINKLFHLGWPSLVFMDNVNRRALFCMKEFNGLCSIVPYSYIFSSLGHSKVFDSMEDVRKQAGSIFSMRKSSSLLI